MSLAGDLKLGTGKWQEVEMEGNAEREQGSSRTM